MTKDELSKEISQITGVDKVEVIRILESFMFTVKDNMTKGKNIYLRSFGTFLVKKRAKKTARNITKKTSIIIPAHFVPAFKPAKEFMDKIKSK